MAAGWTETRKIDVGTAPVQINTVLAAVAVSDIEASIGWYERLFGRPVDHRPMKEAAEWRLAAGGGVQLVQDPMRAGGSMATLGIKGIDALVTELHQRHIEGHATPPGDGPFRLLRLPDPDGNVLTFAEPDGRTD
jgi:catechol 2,3-dioxygenase-like lactoylglutathione lyase family enzyme